MRTLRAKTDPLSMIVRFSNRNLAKEMIEEFETAWSMALTDLQEKVYDRTARLESLLKHRKPKEEVYFIRKTQEDLDDEDLDDSEIRYSTATQKLTWLEQKESRKHTFRKLQARAGEQFCHIPRLAQKEVESDEESDSDNSEADFVDSSDSEHEYYITHHKAIARRKRRTPAEKKEFAQFQKKFATSTRVSAPRTQYDLQNIKRPKQEWKEKQYQFVRDEESGANDRRVPGIKPYRPLRPGARKKNAKIYAIN